MKRRSNESARQSAAGYLWRVLLRSWTALIASVLVWAAPQVAFPADQQKPNIVLIYADDLGYGDVSCYGARRVQTPNIDRLARDGLRFTDAHCSSSTCTPSRYSMLTGEYAWRRRGTGVLAGDAPLIIEPGRVTFPMVLQRAGYQTGIIGKWHLGLGLTNLNWSSDIEPGPLEVGFNYCFLMPATGDRVPCVYVENHRVVGLVPGDPLKVSFAEDIGDEPTGRVHPELLNLRPSHGHDQTIVNGISRIGSMSGGKSARWVDEDMADTYVKKATEFIERNRTRPFFLEFATHDIHVPRVPHARFAGQNAMGPRGDVIVELDWCVGELLAVLERNGLAASTLVIFSSDNGPVVDDGYQDGAKEKLGDHRPAGSLRGGKYSIFEGGSRIPFIVRWPGHVAPGVSDALISQVDFVATFAALVGQSFDRATAPDSQNVLSALLGKSPQGRATLVEHSGGLALRQGSWKFIPVRPGRAREPLTDTDTGNSPQVQLYDLASDLGETNNLAEANPEKVRELEDLLKAAQVNRVVFHDGFETPWPQNPPVGWAMWGAEPSKLATNYTLDTAHPRWGRQCFRIHHPANTGGYIVLTPGQAIHPKAAMLYTVSFWARADRPGWSQFRWTAYQSVNPFTDSPTPGSLSFQIGPEWQRFTTSIREGLDFFEDQSRFLLPTFLATTDEKQERTLWLDDVEVSEQPDPSPVALLNQATIAHQPLQHRLRPADQLEFTLDFNQRLGRVTSQVTGISFHRLCGWTGQPYNREGDYTLNPKLENAIRDLHLPMTRFYAVGEEPFGLESAIDKAAEICRRVGVAQDGCVLEFEEQEASTKLPPEVWVRGIRHSLENGFAFHHWEIANEPYSSLWGHGQAFPTPEAFIEHFQAVSSAIRGADAKARIGLDIDAEQVRWGNYLLKALAGSYDFVAPHYYCGADVHGLPFEDLVLTENYRMLDRALRVDALLRAYNPGREICQLDTEWGMISSTPEGKAADYEDRNANVMGTLHRAVRMIYYAREGLLQGASGWQMLSRLNAQGFGILSQDAPDQRFMLYWLYYYFNRHLGQWALATDGTAPYYRSAKADPALAGPSTPVLASLSSNEREIFLVMANGSWSRAAACRIDVRGFGRFSATGVALGNAQLDGKPLLKSKETAVSDLPLTVSEEVLSCSLPPHSVAFVTVTKDISGTPFR